MVKQAASCVTVRLFGVLKTAATGGEVAIELPNGASAADLRSALLEKLGPNLSEQGRAALEASAIGSEDRLLLDEEPIGDLRVAAILPPVSGG